MKCHYCKVNSKRLTKDHIVPRSRAGVDEQHNVVFACQPCNSAKGEDWPTCTCSKCQRAIDMHWQMIEDIKRWSPKWAAQLKWAAENGRPHGQKRDPLLIITIS